jgi:hypothetical protein
MPIDDGQWVLTGFGIYAIALMTRRGIQPHCWAIDG